MKNKTLVTLTLVASVLMACNSSDTETIKTNLGPFQYMGVDPQLSFSIPTAEFEAPKTAYDSPTVKFTVNIKQNNKKFPLSKYQVSAPIDVIDSQGTKRTTVLVNGEVENGVVSVSGIDSLYGLKVKDEAELKSLKLQIKSYSWFPSFKLKPFDASTSTTN